MKKNNYMVSIRCMTYNQAPYIEDALNGFTMQKTDFPFVCCIVDDASTDDEPEILRKYLQDHFDLEDKSVIRNEETDDFILCFAQHKENKNCFFAVLWLKYNHYGSQELKNKKLEYISEWDSNAKYIALCEGDDYWIYFKKLQTQFDYLEAHPSCTVSYSNFNILYNKSGRVIKNVFDSLPARYKHYEKIEDFILNTPYMCPPSWLMRRDVLYKVTYTGVSVDVTFELFTFLMSQGCPHYLPITCCVYRVLQESASHNKNPNLQLERRKKLLKLQLTLIEKYKRQDIIKRKCIERFYRKNLLFFVENNFKDEIQKAKTNLGEITIKEKFLILVSMNPFIITMLRFAHRVNNYIERY